ncbi:lytic murein transglycosylase [Oricola indica]|uniref:lytic murein transglycosylase n=1 Tax=Oricola indica TaxID=2872591 RepID=UPI003CCBB003
MRNHARILLAGLALSAVPAAAFAQNAPCGGDFSAWRDAMVAEARAAGVGNAGLNALSSARIDPEVLKRDRAQGVFTLDFATFARRLISQNRMDVGRSKLKQYASTFQKARSEYGVAPEVITAFWGLETDFGGYQGDFNTLNSIATLAHDCRRPELFRPQLISLARLIDLGVVPRDITGAWAGEIGQVQVLPDDYLTKGRDGDGDGQIKLKTSSPDAIMTAANFLQSLGWRANEPWLIEVKVPAEMEWYDTGLHESLPVSEWKARGVTPRSGSLPDSAESHLLIPMGRKGPAFIAYPNFKVFLEWNQSLTYVLTAAYFATRLGGAPIFDEGNPEPGLNQTQMKALQRGLTADGFDVGEIDGILGAGTRDAVREEQRRLGMPADAWPTVKLLNAL